MFALLATVFLVAEIFSDSCYSIYFLLFFRFNNNHDVCILFVMANFILCYTRYILKSDARTPRTVTKFAVKTAIDLTSTI